MHRYITLNENNLVIAVRFGKEIVLGEIESEVGECGQIMQTDGNFITPEQPVIETVEDKLLILEQNQLILMDAIATLYETIIGGV